MMMLEIDCEAPIIDANDVQVTLVDLTYVD